MRRAGCYTINFGVESGHPTILKNIKKDVRVDRIYKAHELTRKHGIRTYTTFLVGSIGETEETIQTTMKVAEGNSAESGDVLRDDRVPGHAALQRGCGEGHGRTALVGDRTLGPAQEHRVRKAVGHGAPAPAR